MKKLALFLFSLLLIQNFCMAKDTIEFNFPDSGWHQVQSPDGQENKKCYVPYNQSAQDYREMLIFYERTLQNADISPAVILQKQLGKDKNNFKDIAPKYVVQNPEDSMALWCSQMNNTCALERAFQGKNGVIVAIYTNKTPHYSQNMFGRWSNILSSIKVYEPTSQKTTATLIEL